MKDIQYMIHRFTELDFLLTPFRYRTAIDKVCYEEYTVYDTYRTAITNICAKVTQLRTTIRRQLVYCCEHFFGYSYFGLSINSGFLRFLLSILQNSLLQTKPTAIVIVCYNEYQWGYQFNSLYLLVRHIMGMGSSFHSCWFFLLTEYTSGCVLQKGTFPLCINSYSASHDNWCTATLWNRIMTAQWKGMEEVGSARYEPALLPPCPSIRVLSYSNCQRSTRSHQQSKG